MADIIVVKQDVANIIVVKQNVAEKVAVNPSPATIAGVTLVPATNATLGGVIVGDNLTITGSGVLSAQPGGVTGFNNRTGNVSLTSNDVTTALTYSPIATPSNSTANQVLTYNGTAWRSANHTNCITTTNGNNTFTVNTDGFGFNKIMANASEYVFPWLKLNDNLYRFDGKRNMQLVWKHYPTSAGYTATALTLGDTYARINAVTGASVGPDPGDVGFYPNGFGLGVHDYTHPYDITTKYWADLKYAPASVTNYSLPTASATVLGGIMVGANLTITNGVLSASSSVTSLAQLSDTQISSLSPGDLLSYDQSILKWVNTKQSVVTDGGNF